jgi:chaperone required for assembly of F1-ATPase
MKRFYKLVSIDKGAQGYAVHLDGRPVKTTGGKILSAHSENLANALQREWAAQENTIKPQTMPLTQILNTQLDQVAVNREAMSKEVLKYFDTDLLCYRAGPQPEGQAEAQVQAWDPWLKWFEKRFGFKLETTTALTALHQPQGAHEAVKSYVQALSDAQFTVLQIVVPLSGSLILGLAFVEQAIDPETLFAAIRVEENFKAKIYNEEFYGPDPAQGKKDQAIRADLEAAEQYLKF